MDEAIKFLTREVLGDVRLCRLAPPGLALAQLGVLSEALPADDLGAHYFAQNR